MEKTKLEYALEYAKKGWAVFPVNYVKEGGVCSCPLKENCGNIGKHPNFAVGCYHGVNDASKDEGIIRSWWEKDPESNIGLACGKISGISVLDIDFIGHDSNNSLAPHEDLPPTLTFKSGSGGLHKIYKYSENGKFVFRFRKNIECLSDGRYIVAPPSNHKSGGLYEVWEDREIADFPESLVKDMPRENKISDFFKGADVNHRHDLNNHFTGWLASVYHQSQKTLNPMSKEAVLSMLMDRMEVDNAKSNDKKQLKEYVDQFTYWLAKDEVKEDDVVAEEMAKPLPESELEEFEKKYKLEKASDIFKEQLEEITWYVENLLPKSSDGLLVEINGSKGQMKSFFLLCLIESLISGKDFLNHFKVNNTARVLLIDQENGILRGKKRLRMFEGNNSDNFFTMYPRDFAINEKEVKNLIGFCKKNEIKFIFLDSLARFHSFKENSADEMKQLTRLERYITDAGINVVFLHHGKKPSNNPNFKGDDDASRGSGEIGAGVDIVLSLKKTLSEGEKRILVKMPKHRDIEELDDFLIAYDLDEIFGKSTMRFAGLCKEELDKEENNNNEVAKETILEFVKSEKLAKRMPSQINIALYCMDKKVCGKHKAFVLLQELVDSELVDKVIGSHNTYGYIPV